MTDESKSPGVGELGYSNSPQCLIATLYFQMKINHLKIVTQLSLTDLPIMMHSPSYS